MSSSRPAATVYVTGLRGGHPGREKRRVWRVLDAVRSPQQCSALFFKKTNIKKTYMTYDVAYWMGLRQSAHVLRVGVQFMY